MTSSRLSLVALIWLAVAVGTRAGYVGHREATLDDNKFEDLDDVVEGDDSRNDDASVEKMLERHILAAKEEEDKLEQEKNEKNEKNEKRHYSFHSHHYGANISPALEAEHKRAMIMESGLRKLAKEMGLTTKEQKEKLFGNVLSDDIKRQLGCEEKSIECDQDSRFRTVGGLCNNLKNPFRGAANTRFVRLEDAEADYGDDIGTPRLAKSDSKLPNCRRVSFKAFTDQDKLSKTVTHLVMIWGQFIDHDITLAAHPESSGCNGQCSNPGTNCFGIRIPADDPDFPQEPGCIQVTRDAAAPTKDCRVKVREQVNTLSAYIDGSAVYGSDPDTQARVRDLDSDLGLMKETKNPNGHNFLSLLPEDPGNSNCFPDDPDNEECFTAGDVRVNENPGLMTIHTLWVREHNRIARKLKDINPCWKGEQIYQETRKIVGAMIQRITYNEFLAEILDEDTRRKFSLNLQQSGFFTGYKENVDATIINSFAGAAYRFGHSLIRETFSRHGPSPRHKEFEEFKTKDFYNPTPLYDVCNGGVDGLFRGLYTDPAQAIDGHFASAIQIHLQREEGDMSDLPAINCQRGRDHGLPGYNTFRKACGLDAIESFGKFVGVIPKAIIPVLKELYEHPDDVDLFVGGILEIPQPDHVLGDTFSCILGRQFKRLRVGDRFWYETDDPVTGFTPEQLKEIQKVTLARVICDNSDSIKQIPLKVLAAGSKTVPCRDLKRMNLRKWNVEEDVAEEAVGV